jgi:hypothetical protein
MDRLNSICSKLAAGILAAVPVMLAPQASAGSINLPVGTNVTVLNPSLPVTAADNPAFQPYVSSLPKTTCGTGNVLVTLPAIPAGQTLVIEMLNVEVAVPVGMSLAVLNLHTGLASGPYNAPIPATLQYSDGFDNYYLASEAVKYYVQGGVASSFYVDGFAPPSYTGSQNVCFFAANIYGYLVNTP